MLQLHVGRAGDGFHFLLDQLAGLLQHGHVFAKKFHRHVAAHAGDELVEAHLNRLGEFVIVAGNFLHRLFQFRDQIRLGFLRVGPFLARLHDDEPVRHTRRHGIRRDFGRAHFCKNNFHLRELLEPPFQRVLHLDRLGQACAGNAQGVHRHVAFIQTRNKLRSHS